MSYENDDDVLTPEAFRWMEVDWASQHGLSLVSQTSNPSAAGFGSLGRRYIAFGEGKAAEDAAFVAAVGDLEKGFEMVKHLRAQVAAIKHGYPLAC